MTVAASPKGQGEANGHGQERGATRWRYLQAPIVWKEEESNGLGQSSKTRRTTERTTPAGERSGQGMGKNPDSACPSHERSSDQTSSFVSYQTGRNPWSSNDGWTNQARTRTPKESLRDGQEKQEQHQVLALQLQQAGTANPLLQLQNQPQHPPTPLPGTRILSDSKRVWQDPGTQARSQLLHHPR